MSYFSRLTDIITCNLTEILASESDPEAAIEQIIREMDEGRAGALRSVETATASEERLKNEITEHQGRAEHWNSEAKGHLQSGDEEQARLALVRKREILDVIAGLEQQLQSAGSTRQHLTTTLRALEARMADARRKLKQLQEGATTSSMVDNVDSPSDAVNEAPSTFDARAQEIDDELDALRRELGR